MRRLHRISIVSICVASGLAAAFACQLLGDRAAHTTLRDPPTSGWPLAVDDAPKRGNAYAYARFDRAAGPFSMHELPPIYVVRAKRSTACFSGRIDGRVRHIVVLTDFGRATTHEPASDAGWVTSGCRDALRTPATLLNQRAYLKTRMQLLPDTPGNSEQRKALAHRLEAQRP